MAKANYKIKPGYLRDGRGRGLMACQFKTLPQAIEAAVECMIHYDQVEIYIRPSQFRLITLTDDGYTMPSLQELATMKVKYNLHHRTFLRKYSRLLRTVEEQINLHMLKHNWACTRAA
jgi:Domain of unknown function DUF1828